MSLFIEARIRDRARAELRKGVAPRRAEQVIVEATASFSAATTYDIFLSHSVRDAELILGMKGTLEDLGYLVYVDWVEDSQLDRSRVTAATAERLRERMRTSRSLIFVTTSNSTTSRWMPWECGFFDGHKGKVAIAPIQTESSTNSFAGQEYLGLYPYVVRQESTLGKEILWIRVSDTRYMTFDAWVQTPNRSLVWHTG